MRGAIRLIAALIVLAALVVIAFALLRELSGAVRVNAGGGSGEPDPMFAEPAERVTRPPEGPEEAPVVSADEDPSKNWVYETLTPVEHTAAELAEMP